MPSSCPVCEQPIGSTVAHCAVCGFPTALAIEGLRSRDDPGALGTDGNGSSVATHPPAPATRTPALSPVSPPSPEAELSEAISRDLRGKMDLVRGLGRGPDVTSDLCQAALIEADGRVAEALEILRSTQARFDIETDRLLHERLETLEQHQQELRTKGVRLAVLDDLRRLSQAIDSGDRGRTVAELVDVERQYAQFESDWRGLQSLLGQIDALHHAAEELRFPLGEISGERAAIRDRLEVGELTQESLTAIAQRAAQTLVLLHEAIPASLEEELKKSAVALDKFPEESSTAARARRLHLETGRHLRKGRLSEAMQNLRDLRHELTEFERAAAERPVVAPAVREARAPPRESDDEMLGRLLKKARTLAGRVRTLPPESETSREAAVQIREATELLRSRKLQEADEALSRLMRMLSTERTVS